MFSSHNELTPEISARLALLVYETSNIFEQEVSLFGP